MEQTLQLQQTNIESNYINDLLNSLNYKLETTDLNNNNNWNELSNLFSILDNLMTKEQCDKQELMLSINSNYMNYLKLHNIHMYDYHVRFLKRYVKNM